MTSTDEVMSAIDDSGRSRHCHGTPTCRRYPWQTRTCRQRERSKLKKLDFSCIHQMCVCSMSTVRCCNLRESIPSAADGGAFMQSRTDEAFKLSMPAWQVQLEAGLPATHPRTAAPGPTE